MKRTLVLLAGLLLCVPSTMSGALNNILQIYPGPPRPRAEVAIVAHAGNVISGSSLGVTAINDTMVHGHGQSISAFEMLPGHYVFLTTYQTQIERGLHALPVAFDVEAGKEYLLRDRFHGKGDKWMPEVVEQTPVVDPRMNHVPVCWMMAPLQGTLVQWDKRAHKLTIKERETDELIVFATGGGFSPFALEDMARHGYRDLVPGKRVSVSHATCQPDRIVSLRIDD